MPGSRRSRQSRDKSNVAIATKGARTPVTIPEPDLNWHPRAVALFEAALESGQADFYQSSDLQMLAIAAEMVSDYLATQDAYRAGQVRRPASAMALAEALGILRDLGATEGARRQMRLELQEPEHEEPSHGITLEDLKGVS